MSLPRTRRNQVLDYLRVDNGAAPGDLTDRVGELLEVGDPFLQEISPTPGPPVEKGECIFRVRVLAENHNTHFGMR